MFFISTDGKTLLGPYENIESGFSEGLALVKFGYQDYWYIDKEGNKILGPYKYSMQHTFHNGYAISLNNDGKNVVINKEGKEIISGFYDTAFCGNFSEGFIKLKYEDGFYYVNDKAEKLFGPFEDGSDFSDGLCPVKIDSKWWYMDRSGQKKYGPYYHAYDFVNGAARVDVEKKVYAIINTNGEYKMGPVYEVKELVKKENIGDLHVEYVTTIYDGFVVVSINGTGKSYVSFDNNYENIYLSKDYDFITASEFVNGKAIVTDEQFNTYVIDKKGRKIFDFKFGFRVSPDMPFTKDGMVLCFNNEGKYGFYNDCGEMLSVTNYIKRKIFYKEKQPAAKYDEISNTKETLIQNKETYHVVGVRFNNARTGCYYYYGDNKHYNIGDKVLVPTGNNGNQEAKVVFKKVYTRIDDIPYGGNLKTVIRKISDNGFKTKKYNNSNKIYYGYDDFYDIFNEDDLYDSFIDDDLYDSFIEDDLYDSFIEDDLYDSINEDDYY